MSKTKTITSVSEMPDSIDLSEGNPLDPKFWFLILEQDARLNASWLKKISSWGTLADCFGLGVLDRFTAKVLVRKILSVFKAMAEDKVDEFINSSTAAIVDLAIVKNFKSTAHFFKEPLGSKHGFLDLENCNPKLRPYTVGVSSIHGDGHFFVDTKVKLLAFLEGVDMFIDKYKDNEIIYDIKD